MEEDHQEWSFCLKFADVGSQQGNLECRAHLADCTDTERFLPHEHGGLPSGEIETACGNSGSRQSSIQELDRSSQHGTLLEGPNLELILLQSSLKTWHFAFFRELLRETTVAPRPNRPSCFLRQTRAADLLSKCFSLAMSHTEAFCRPFIQQIDFFFSSPEAAFLTPLDAMVTPTERPC